MSKQNLASEQAHLRENMVRERKGDKIGARYQKGISFLRRKKGILFRIFFLFPKSSPSEPVHTLV